MRHDKKKQTPAKKGLDNHSHRAVIEKSMERRGHEIAAAKRETLAQKETSRRMKATILAGANPERARPTTKNKKNDSAGKYFEVAFIGPDGNVAQTMCISGNCLDMIEHIPAGHTIKMTRRDKTPTNN